MALTRPFDEHPDRYDEWFDAHRFVYRSELEAIAHLVPDNGQGIEIGVGSGRFAVPLSIGLGIEPSRPMGERAAARGIRVVAAVAEHLPFVSESLDFALMVTTICFLDDAVAAFGEMARVLKPGCDVVIGFVDRASSLGRRYQRHKLANAFYRDATFYSTDEVATLLSETGFGETKTVQTVFGELSEIAAVQDFRPGSGDGGFVVVCARKPNARS
jgi:SAM-dependent methyltransferase